jgi:hypothetical protein
MENKMNALFKTSILLLLTTLGGFASNDSPAQGILTDSKDVVLAQVDSVDAGKFKFSVKEVLKGKSHGLLVLKSDAAGLPSKSGDECILCYYAGTKGTVSASYDYGDPEWFCIPVSMKDGKVVVDGVGSIDQVKAICASKPASK